MIEPKVKQARMKMEVMFARDNSTTLPRGHSLFKIQITRQIRNLEAKKLLSLVKP